MRRSAALSALLATVLAGCTDVLNPSNYIGNYSLTAVNGSPPPDTMAVTPIGCSMSIGNGTLVLADGAFSLYFYEGGSCPGGGGYTNFTQIGGGLQVANGRLSLRAIDPHSATGATFDATAVIAGSEVDLTLPPGALGLVLPAVLHFIPSGVRTQATAR